MYIAEMTPKESRGMLGSTIGFSFNLGLNIGLFSNIGFAKFGVGWRVAIAIEALLGLVFAVGMKFMPHSPRYVSTASTRSQKFIYFYW